MGPADSLLLACSGAAPRGPLAFSLPPRAPARRDRTRHLTLRTGQSMLFSSRSLSWIPNRPRRSCTPFQAPGRLEGTPRSRAGNARAPCCDPRRGTGPLGRDAAGAIGQRAPKRGRTRGTKAGTRAPATAPALPFDAGVARLAEALMEAGAGVEAVDEEAGTWVAWLPTVGGRPVTSSPLIDEPPANATEAGIAPWAVSGLRLWGRSGGRPARRLCRATDAGAGDRRRQDAGVRLGRLPVRRGAGGPAAVPARPANARTGRIGRRWEPVVSGADAHRLAKLARAMPSACRALGRELGTPPETHPTTAASAFRRRDGRPSRPVLDGTDGPLRREAAGAAEGRALRQRPRPMAARAPVARRAAWRATRPSWSGSPSRSATWRRPIAVAAAAPFRLCFRLEEPEVEDDDATAASRVVREPGAWTSATCSRPPTTPACSCRPPTPGTRGAPGAAVLSAGRLRAPRVPAGGPGAGGDDLPPDRGEPEGGRARRLRARRHRRPRVPHADSLAAGAGRLRRLPARRGGAQGDQAPPRGPGRRQVAQAEEQVGPLARADPQVRVGGRAGRPEADAQGAGGAGQAEGRRWCRSAASGSSSAPRRSRRRSTSGRPRASRRSPPARRRPDGPGRRQASPGGLAFEGVAGRRAGSPSCSTQLEGRRGFEALPTPRRASAGRCGPTRRGATRGSASSAAGASAPAWPTTWAWARRSRPSPCSSATGSRAAPKAAAADPADLPDVGRRQLAEGGRAVHARPARDGPPRPGPRSRAPSSRSRRPEHALVLSSFALLHRDFDAVRAGALGRRDPRRGPEHQEPARPSRRRPPGRSKADYRDRADRHAGREPRRRPLVDHGVPQPRPARHPGRVQAGASTCRSRSTATPRPPDASSA